MTREEFIRSGVERGVLNSDGTIKRPPGEPCLGLPYPGAAGQPTPAQ
jgi:hypothetical protein